VTISTWRRQSIYVYFNLLYAVVMFIVPVTSLSVLSRQMIVALRSARQMRTEMIGQLTRHGLATYRHEDEITVMLIAIVIMFIITQTPALITQVFLIIIITSSIIINIIFLRIDSVSSHPFTHSSSASHIDGQTEDRSQLCCAAFAVQGSIKMQHIH